MHPVLVPAREAETIALDDCAHHTFIDAVSGPANSQGQGRPNESYPHRGNSRQNHAQHRFRGKSAYIRCPPPEAARRPLPKREMTVNSTFSISDDNPQPRVNVIVSRCVNEPLLPFQAVLSAPFHSHDVLVAGPFFTEKNSCRCLPARTMLADRSATKM